MVSVRNTFSFLFSSLLFVSHNIYNVDAQACQVAVPQNPLSAVGLATSYLLSGCSQAQATQTFVEGTIIDTTTGAISVYNPIIVDATNPTPFIPLKTPTLPTNYVVGLWFGTNGCTTTLVSTSTAAGSDSLVQGNCVNGGGYNWSIFGQFAACNAVAFWAAVSRAVISGLLVIPPLGNDINGNPCPTTHDFGVVDQDQSDNVVTKYIVNNNGQVAQFNNANLKIAQAAGNGATVIFNGSDEALYANFLAPAINCSVWKVVDLSDGVTLTASLALNELRAVKTVPPTAFVPANHAMTLNGGKPDFAKMNAYRMQVNQMPTNNPLQASLQAYCSNLYAVGSAKIANWLAKTLTAQSPSAATPSLGVFLVQRFLASVGVGNLNCSSVVPGPVPLKGIVDANGNILAVPPAGVPIAQFVGATNYQQSLAGEGQDQVGLLLAAGVTVNAGSGVTTGTVTTTTSTTAFNAMWFGIGIAIGASVILLLDLAFLCFKQSKSRSSSVNDALARV